MFLGSIKKEHCLNWVNLLKTSVRKSFLFVKSLKGRLELGSERLREVACFS